MTGAGADVTGFDAIKAVADAANAPVGNGDLLAVERDVLAAPAAALRKMHADRAPYVPAQYDAALAQIVDGLAQVERVLASGADAASGGAGVEGLQQCVSGRIVQLQLSRWSCSLVNKVGGPTPDLGLVGEPKSGIRPPT